MKRSSSIVDEVARAVLYEGYMLYPYRPSLKNQQRFTFGSVQPRSYAEAHGGEGCSIVTECLLEVEPEATLQVRVRFLHLIDRGVGVFSPPLAHWPELGEPAYKPVESLQLGDQTYQAWQEAEEREVVVGGLSPAELFQRPRQESFAFPAVRDLEALRDKDAEIVGVLIRQQQSLEGVVTVQAEALEGSAMKLSVTIHNETPLADPLALSRDELMMRSLASTHTILSVDGGRFISLTDPPAPLREAAASCRNQGAWPVLVGEPGQTDTMLSAPIILYDYPQIAPESAGDLFDATEIDEILTLRLLTLTDDEKCQMSSVDERTRELLRRTQALAGEHLVGLHGAFRNPDSAIDSSATGGLPCH